MVVARLAVDERIILPLLHHISHQRGLTRPPHRPRNSAGEVGPPKGIEALILEVKLTFLHHYEGGVGAVEQVGLAEGGDRLGDGGEAGELRDGEAKVALSLHLL